MKKAELDKQCAEFTAKHGLEIKQEHKLVLDNYMERGMDETEAFLTFGCQFPRLDDDEIVLILKKYMISKRNDPSTHESWICSGIYPELFGIGIGIVISILILIII